MLHILRRLPRWWVCGLALAASAVGAADWPWFLGPRHNGISSETKLLDSWPAEGPPVVWQHEVGAGYSAPSVRGERLVLHHRLENEEVVEAFHALTGERQWRYAAPSRFKDPYGYNNGPRCTPLLTEDRCYTLGAEGRLTCLNLADGQRIWERPLKEEFDIPDGFFGVGCSPILEGEMLIVLVGGQPNSGVVAFDAATGKTLWEAVGQRTWDGVREENGDLFHWASDEMVVSYSSPICATIHGHRHLLCLMRQGLVSLDPATGKERFKYWFRPTVHESVNAARPVVWADHVLISAAYRLGSACLSIHPDGAGYDVAWRNQRNLLAHWSTPIAIGGYFYGFTGRHEQEGELRCLQGADGNVVWSTTGWEKPLEGLGQDPATGEVVDRATGQVVPWPFYGRGSLTYADGKFIVLGERGTLALVKVDPQQFSELARCRAPGMSYPSWTAPVLANGRLYLRDEDSLVCLDLRSPEALPAATDARKAP